MAKPKTKVYEAYARIKFEIRVTPKKLYVDMVNSFGDKRVYCYVDRCENNLYRNQPKYYYIASKPNSKWTKQANTIGEIVKVIEHDLDMTIPEEAVDEFTARIVMSEVANHD